MTPETDIYNKIQDNKKKIVLHIISETISNLHQVNSIEELNAVIQKLAEVNSGVNSRKLSDLERILIRKRSSASKFFISYRITHEISQNMDKAIMGFLDDTLTVEEIQRLIFTEKEGTQAKIGLNTFTKIISERSDIYPVNSDRVPELLKRYLEICNDDSRKGAFMNMALKNLCQQGKYDEAEKAIDGVKKKAERVDSSDGKVKVKRELTEEEIKFNKEVENLKVSLILSRKISKILLDTIRNKVSDEEDERIYAELKKLLNSSTGIKGNKEDFWNQIILEKDSLGTDITIGLISRDERSFV